MKNVKTFSMKALSLLLAVVMCVGLLNLPAFATTVGGSASAAVTVGGNSETKTIYLRFRDAVEEAAFTTQEYEIQIDASLSMKNDVLPKAMDYKGYFNQNGKAEVDANNKPIYAGHVFSSWTAQLGKTADRTVIDESNVLIFNASWKDCKDHVDADKSGKCDKCGAEVEVEAKTITVTFEDGEFDASIFATQTYTAEVRADGNYEYLFNTGANKAKATVDEVTGNSIPVRDGYTFTGWDKGMDLFGDSDDVSYMAMWEKIDDTQPDSSAKADLTLTLEIVKVNGEEIGSTKEVTVNSGDTVMFKISVKNTGNVAIPTVTVYDVLDEGMALTGSQPRTENGFYWTINNPRSTSQTHTVKVTNNGSEPITLTNSASVDVSVALPTASGGISSVVQHIYVQDSVKVTVNPDRGPKQPVVGASGNVDLSKLKVKFYCEIVNAGGNHSRPSSDFGEIVWRDNAACYTIVWNGGNTATLTLHGEELLKIYNAAIAEQKGTDAHHLFDSSAAEQTVTLTWNATTQKWTAATQTVTFRVSCPSTVIFVDGTANGKAFARQEYTNVYATPDTIGSTNSGEAINYDFRGLFNTTASVTHAGVDENGNPTRDGYEFVLWAYDKRGQTTTYTARWQCDGNHVDTNGDGLCDKDAYNKGVVKCNERITCECDDCYCGGTEGDICTECKGLCGDKCACDQPEFFTVTFNYGDGRENGSEQVKAGGKATEPAKPTREGYRFDGWYTEAEDGAKYNFNSAVNADITLYAHWTKTYALTTVNRWSGMTSVRPYEEGQVFFADGVASIPGGKVLAYWIDETTGEKYYEHPEDNPANLVVYHMPAHDLTLHAVFTITTTFKDGVDGAAFADYTVQREFAAPEESYAYLGETHERQGFTFAGWVETAKIDGNVTYTATWTEIETQPEPETQAPSTSNDVYYTLVYNMNDGTGMTMSTTQANNPSFTITGTEPARDGYTFEGWAASADGAAEYQAGSRITISGTSQVLYAVWSEVSVEIPEEDPPLSDLPDVEIPEEDPPLSDLPDVEIPEEDPPLSDLPDVEIPEEDPPLSDLPELDIPDGDVPLASVPDTGDYSHIWGFVALISGMGLAVLVLTNKKREEIAE